MTYFRLLLLFSLIWLIYPAHAQEDTESEANDTINHPYRQGRWLVGISGSINSSNAGRGFSGQDTATFNNGHLVNLQGGYFVNDRIPIGIFVASRSQNSFERFERDAETLFAGIWARYYLLPQNATLYPELAIFYSHFFNRNQLLSETGPEIDSQIDGNGYGVKLGIGFSYTLADLLVFDIGLNYSFLRIRGDFNDNIQNIFEKRSFSTQDVDFNFGFKILIRQ